MKPVIPGIARMLIALACLFASAWTDARAEPLTVRVNDTEGVPGGTIAVVLRTYASRPIGQGQLCFQAAPTVPGGQAPLAAATGSEVYSDVPDVSSVLTPALGLDPQTIVLQFDSPSVTVNASDGPLAVLFMQLSPTVLPGETYELVLDVQNTTLVGADGQPILVVPRNGTLTIRDPNSPIGVSASAEDVVPGDDALLSFATAELFAIASGRVGLVYDTAIATGPPTVSMSPRYGASMFTTDLSTPGLVVVDFESPDASLNSTPGDLIEIRVPTDGSIPIGTMSPVSLDPALTFLNDALGQPLSIDLDDDVLEFVAPPTPSPGEALDLTVGRAVGDQLQLTWTMGCGATSGFAIYRGDLGQGYGSLALEPGNCAIPGLSANIPRGAGAAEFFIVVPFDDGEEGSYGRTSSGEFRPPASTVCYPQGPVSACAP